MRSVCKWAAMSILFALLAGGCDASRLARPDPSLLFTAVREGDLTTVRQLLDAGVDANAKEPDTFFGGGDTVLIVAVHPETVKNIDVVQALLDAGADVNGAGSGGLTALMQAAITGDVQLVHLLLDAGADVNVEHASGNTALTYAADDEDVAVLQALLDAGADINAQNASGASALMYAANPGSLENVLLLLSAGADVNLRTQDGQTALLRAAGGIAGGMEVEKIMALLAAGAQINAQDEKGRTALMIAVEHISYMLSVDHDYLPIVQTLLEAGTDIDLQSTDGQTALMLAALQGSTEVVSMLLAAGADVNVEDANGYTALLLAEKSGADDVVQLLLSADAVVKDAPPAEGYFDQGVALLESGDLMGAIDQFNTAIELKPDHAQAYLLRGLSYLRLDEFQTAFQDLTIAIDLAPQSLDAYQYRGAANFHLSHYAAMLQDCSSAIGLSNGFVTPVEPCYNMMGRIAARDFDAVQDAMEDFNSAINGEPDMAVAYLFRGFLNFTLGEVEAGVLDMEKGLDMDSTLTTSAFYVWFFFRAMPEPVATRNEIKTAKRLLTPGSPLEPIFSQILASTP